MTFVPDIDPSYLLHDPPELTREVASRRWREINVLLHSIVLLGDEVDGRRPLLPVLRIAATLGSSERAILYQWDDVASSLHPTALLGVPAAHPAAIGSNDAQARACLLHRKPALVTAPPEPFLQEELSALSSSSVLSVPMTHQGLPWGVIQLLREKPFHRDEAILLWLFALVLEGVLPTLLGSRRYRELTLPVDVATGLLTPDHFRRRLAWEIQRAAWVERPVTVACIQVTEMLHGRPRGGSLSMTPREASQVIRKTLRDEDSATCLGGHHFIAAMPDATEQHARRTADLIREGFLTSAAGTLPVFDIVTGFATFPEVGPTEAELIGAACAAAGRAQGRVSRNPLSS